MRPDFITSESEHEIQNWAARAGFKQADKHWRWGQFLLCAPKLDWVEDRIANLPRQLPIGTVDLLGPLAEWRHLIVIALKISDRLGSNYHSLGRVGIFDYYRDETICGRKLIFGSERRKGGVDDIRPFLGVWEVGIGAMSTPADVEDVIWCSDGFRTHTWKCDSV